MVAGGDAGFAVLLVEDDEAMADVIEAYIVRESPEWRSGAADVEAVTSLSAGLERLADGAYDVVLLDLGLPETAGLQTLDRVVAARPDLPVVVLTGLEDSEVAIRAIREGAQDFLVKSDIDGDRLWRAMRYAVERKRIERALRRHNERLETFASHIASELRAPLSSARRHLGAAEEAPAGAADLRETLDRLEGLVDEVLDIAADMRTIDDPEVVDLEAAVDRAWRIARTEAAALRVGGDLGAVMAEDARVVELLDACFRALLDAGEPALLEVGGLDADRGFYVADAGAVELAGRGDGGAGPPDVDLDAVRSLADALDVEVELVDVDGGLRLEVFGLQPA